MAIKKRMGPNMKPMMAPPRSLKKDFLDEDLMKEF
jgi:hypothetical protein